MIVAEILWDKKVGTYDLIDSNYLTPEPHAHNINIDVEIEVYKIAYDWGLVPTYQYPDGSILSSELIAPIYLGTMKGQVTSGNFTLDSTSDMRSSCSLSIVLEEDSPFIVHASDFTFWQTVWLKIIKTYEYPNDIDMYPMFDWGDRTGLWNNNGLFRSDPSQWTVGWFIPNDGSYNYNASSREFSLSCTDIMACLTDTRGGHLSEWRESRAGLSYHFYDTEKAYEGNEFNNENYNSEFEQQKKNVAMYSSGITLEGSKDLQLEDKQYANYLAAQFNNPDGVSALWTDAYAVYTSSHSKVDDYEINFESAPRNESLSDTYKLIQKFVSEYGHIIPITSTYIRLQNDSQTLPYDIEFNGDVTFYDVLKKITDLYPRQTMYFDTNRRLNIIQTAMAWNETWDTVDFRAREFADLILEEHWNVDLSNVKNFVVVNGRDQTCQGFYWITSYKGLCPTCGTIYDYPSMPSNPERRFCPICAKAGRGHIDLQRLYVTDETFCVQNIGTHKYVYDDDNLLTEQECFDTAKAICLESCRAAKTLSVTLVDRYLSMYQWADKGIGRRIEYKSKLTGETNVYTLLKLNNDFTSGTVTMELEPYYTCRSEYVPFNGMNVLPLPEFGCTVDENGLMTMVINNGWATKYSLFKVYLVEAESDIEDGFDFWFTTWSMNFLGETCEVYTEETETQCQTKVFRHQFTRNGKYIITCQAWNPNILPSSCPNMRVVTVDCFKERLLTHDNELITTHDNDYLMYS